MTTLSRRSFLRGLLSSVAAAALIKNGIVQPEQVIEEPKRRVFDMGRYTYRKSLLKLPGLRGYWPMDGLPPGHVNCRCAHPGYWDWSGKAYFDANADQFAQMAALFGLPDSPILTIRSGSERPMSYQVTRIIQRNDGCEVEFVGPGCHAVPITQGERT